MRKVTIGAMGLAGVVALAGCGGGAMGGAGMAPSGSIMPGTSGGTVTVRITRPAERVSEAITSNAQSVEIETIPGTSPSGTPDDSVIANLPAPGQSTDVTVPNVPTGVHVVEAFSFSGLNGTGTQLDSGVSSPVTILANQTATVSITLSGGGVNLPPSFNFEGIALVSRPEHVSPGFEGGTDLTLVTGLASGGTPTVNSTAITTEQASVDLMVATDDGSFGVSEGENAISVLTGLNTGKIAVSAPVFVDDEGAAAGIQLNNDDKTGLFAGANVQLISGLPNAPVLSAPLEGFRTFSDAMANTQDHTLAVIASAGGSNFSGGDTTQLQVITAANTANPQPGPTLVLPGSDSGFEGKAGMSVSPSDPTRMTVPVSTIIVAPGSSSAVGTGIVLITGLNTATPTVGPIVPMNSLPEGDSVIATTISRDGTLVAVLTNTGIQMFSGVNTGTLTPSSNFLQLDANATAFNSNRAVEFALDNSGIFVSNNDLGAFFIISGFNTATLTLKQTLTLLPAEFGFQDDDAMLLH